MLTTPAIPQLHPALTGAVTEVYVHEGALYFQHDGQRGSWEAMPAVLKASFAKQLAQQAAVLHHLLDWASREPIDVLQQYVSCNFGGYDHVPDIDAAGSLQQGEYHHCGRRGHCRYEGKVCPGLTVAHGVLTKTEVQVLRLVHLPAKTIADRLCIGYHTVNVHLKNLSKKSGYTRPGLVQLAILKGLHQ